MKTTRIMVTGVNGFVGHHLVKELKERGVRVIGIAHTEPDPTLASELEKFISCDLTDEKSVAQLDLNGIDAVIHLAALASQAMSFDQPQLFISANSSMVINLFERVLAQNPPTTPRFITISSGAVYDSNQSMPITEDGKITHGSPYAISKLLGEYLGEYYRKRGIESIVVRPFNHTGPGQLPGYILPDLTKQLIEAGPEGTLKVGNLKTRRDYSDVRDIVKIYADLATASEVKNRLYNACSGKSLSGQEIVDMVTAALYGEQANIKIEVDPTRIRPNDPEVITGGPQRLKDDLGWEPTIPFEQTVRDYITWYKQQA